MAVVRSFYENVNIYDSDDDCDDYVCGRGVCVCEIITDFLKYHKVQMKKSEFICKKKNYYQLIAKLN